MFTTNNKRIDDIFNAIINGQRLSINDALALYNDAPLFMLSHLASIVKQRKSGDNIFYNKNFHIEPTNVCRFHCLFCSYRKEEGESEAWTMTLEQIEQQVKERINEHITEIHLVGGVHPDHSLDYYCAIVSCVRALIGKNVTIKGFSAVEHIYVIDKAGISYKDGLQRLIDSGLNTITGGGAEIFDEQLRERICPDKPTSREWLAFHKAAHELGITTNATMLYGHLESIEQRLDHMNRLREVQDMTGGFSTFIPLKFRSKNNKLSYLGECSVIDDMKTIAISRIFLDNFAHIKAYSPMYGKSTTQMAILFGADDIDGTVKSTTKIYSMAGVDERGMDEGDMINLISECGYIAVERDTFYNPITSN